MSSPKVAIGFDLYGTLLSTESIAKQLAEIYDPTLAKGLAAQWRRYQLEYTWRSNSMGIYRPFSDITRAALKHALAEKGLELSASDEDRLMNAYNGLDTFPEVGKAIDIIAKESSLDAYIFSNGTDAMVSKSVQTSPDLSKFSNLFESGKLVTVEQLRRFKPDPRVYQHLAERTGIEDLSKVWVVTANPFDALGARAAGAQSAWIDRVGAGWVDALGGLIGQQPTIIANGVDEAVVEILARSQTQ